MGTDLMLVVQKEAISSEVEIAEKIKENDFFILQKKRHYFFSRDFELLYGNEKEESFFKTKKSELVNANLIVMIIHIRTPKGIEKFKRLVGDEDPNKAAEGSLRKLFGIDRSRNAIYLSKDQETARRDIEHFFPEFKLQQRATEFCGSFQFKKKLENK